MSTPYNGQNPNGQNPYGENPYGGDQYGANPASGHPEGVSSYGDYTNHDQLQPDYTRGEPGHPGYGMAGGNYNQAPTSYGYEAAPAQQNNGVALAAMIVGILSLPGLLFLFPGLVLGVIALILGIVGVKKANSIVGPDSRKGMAISGIVMGAIATILSVLMIVIGFSFFNKMQEEGVLEACQQYENNREQYEACIEKELEESFNL